MLMVKGQHENCLFKQIKNVDQTKGEAKSGQTTETQITLVLHRFYSKKKNSSFLIFEVERDF